MKLSSLLPLLVLAALMSFSASIPITAQTVRKIVYLRASAGGWEPWIMNPDGSGPTRVCDCPGVQRPVLSPDNLKIAFEMSGDIYFVNTDGTGLRNLTQNGLSNEYATWSPDSTQIAFDGPQAPGTHIFRVNIDGSNLTRLVTNAFRPAWSPDGRKIAFNTTRPTHSRPEVYVVNSDGGGETRITYEFGLGGGYGGFGHPAWSPDSSRVIALRLDYGCGPSWLSGFYVINVNPSRGGLRRVTDCDQRNGLDYEAAWSPSGKKIALGLGDQIYTMNPDGSGKRPVAFHASSYENPSWSPDGKKIVFSYDNYPAENYNEIYLANADGSGQINLTNTPTLKEIHPDWGRGLACDLTTSPVPPIQNVSSNWPYDLNGTNPNWSMTAEVVLEMAWS